MRFTDKKNPESLAFYKLKPDVSEVAKVQKWNYYRALDKLGKIEDKEDQYGIEVLTMFDVLINGCYYIRNGKLEHFVPSGNEFACPNLDNESLDLMYASPYEDSCHVEATLFFSEFGKTWALKEKELKLK